MRAVWVNEGTDVQSWPRLQQLSVTHVFYSERSHTKANLDKARSMGFQQVGLYSNPQWYGFPSASIYAKQLNKTLINKFGVNSAGVQCDVMVNIEKTAMGTWNQPQQNGYVVDFFANWRRVRATRMTSWTMEGGQGGWFYPAMRDPVLGIYNTLLVPQAYDGSMNRWDSHGTVKDVLDWTGLPRQRVVPFNKADEIRVPWSEGFYYMDHLIP